MNYSVPTQSHLSCFRDFPDTSRIWIFQSSRALTSEEELQIETHMRWFVGQWESHGQKLKADFAVLHHYFLVLAVDENEAGASGCSIDKATHQVKFLEQELGTQFFDRTMVLMLDNECVNLSSLNNLPSLVKDGLLGPETLFFDNTVTSLAEWKEKWLKKAGDGWMKRYFPN